MSYFKTDTYKALGLPQAVELLPKQRKPPLTPFQLGWMHGVDVVKGLAEAYTSARLKALDPAEAAGYRLGMACQKARGVA